MYLLDDSLNKFSEAVVIVVGVDVVDQLCNHLRVCVGLKHVTFALKKM